MSAPSASGARASQCSPPTARGCCSPSTWPSSSGAFLLAHWYRFVLPDIEAYALGLEQYARIGPAVSLINVILLALDGWYDPDRVRGTWCGCAP